MTVRCHWFWRPCFVWFCVLRFMFAKGRGLSLTFTHVLVQAPIDGPSEAQTTLSACLHPHQMCSSVLSLPFLHAGDCMCAIAKDLGLSPETPHMRQDIVSSLQPRHGASVYLCWELLSVHVTDTASPGAPQKPGSNKLVIIFRSKLAAPCFLRVCFGPLCALYDSQGIFGYPPCRLPKEPPHNDSLSRASRHHIDCRIVKGPKTAEM